jgi:ribosome biogenesis GTPase A
MARKSTLFLLAIIHFMTVWSTKTTPLLNQTSKDYWALNMETKRSLRKFNNQKIHVIAIGGPTRAGKSFIMNYLLEKVDKLHFGAFVHRATANSVTKGMDIALVEHQGKFLLLIDCEGLGSLSSKMDPKLMLIMSMISQKLMYLTQSFDQTLLDDIGTMLANLSQISTTKENKLPLDTMHMILNKTQFVGENRDEYFFSNGFK